VDLVINKLDDNLKLREFAARHQIPSVSDISSPKFKYLVTERNEQFLFKDLRRKKSHFFSLDLKPMNIDKVFKSNFSKCFLSLDKNLQVLDSTAGLLNDSVHIANMGFQVTAVEKISWLYEVMKNELDLAKLGDSILENIDLQNGDSLELAEKMRPNVIYFDPVFDLKKKATAKQPMELLRSIALDKNPQDRIEQLLDCCSERLIYKRHKKQKSTFQKFITFSVVGKSVTFDVYQK
jgi:hypothetical protein